MCYRYALIPRDLKKNLRKISQKNVSEKRKTNISSFNAKVSLNKIKGTLDLILNRYPLNLCLISDDG